MCCADQRHRRHRQRIGERVGPLRDERLQRMRQAVHAGIGGGARRHAVGQLVVHDRGERQRAETGDQHLLVALGVGDDGEARALAAGAGRGGDGDHRQRAPVGGDRHLVVAHLAAAGGEDRHRLRRVDRRAAAEADQAVEVAALQFGDAGLDHRVGRVGHGVAEHGHRDAGGGQRIEAVLHMARGHHERIGHHQRPRQAEFGQHLGDLPHRAAADLQHAGCGDVGVHCGHGAVLLSGSGAGPFTTKSRRTQGSGSGPWSGWVKVSLVELPVTCASVGPGSIWANGCIRSSCGAMDCESGILLTPASIGSCRHSMRHGPTSSRCRLKCSGWRVRPHSRCHELGHLRYAEIWASATATHAPLRFAMLLLHCMARRMYPRDAELAC